VPRGEIYRVGDEGVERLDDDLTMASGAVDRGGYRAPLVALQDFAHFLSNFHLLLFLLSDYSCQFHHIPEDMNVTVSS